MLVRERWIIAWVVGRGIKGRERVRRVGVFVVDPVV